MTDQVLDQSQPVSQDTAQPQTERYPTQGSVQPASLRRSRGLRRAAKPRLRRWQKAVLGGGTAALIVVAGVGTSMQSPLPVDGIVIAASVDLQPQIASAVAVLPGQSFASVDAGAATGRVLAIEGVEGVDLRWTWWNTLTVDVIERVAVGVQEVPTGGFVVLDADGQQIRTVPQRPAGLALIESVTPDAQSAALEVAALLPPDLVPLTDAVVAAGDVSLSLRLASGGTVLLGQSVDLTEKLLLAGQLLQSTGAETINVSVPERPAVSGIPKPPTP